MRTGPCGILTVRRGIARAPADPGTDPPLQTHRTDSLLSASPPRAAGRRVDSETARTADECIALLEQGLALVGALEDEDYTAAPPWSTAPDDDGTRDARTAPTWSSPAAHTRHLLDFIDCLLAGIDAQRIDYTARKRRPEVESSREAGRRALVDAIEGLERIRSLDAERRLEVRPEPGQSFTRSTLARELQFVTGHAVHHHALIRMTLALRGIEVPAEYGISPSTLAYQAAASKSAATD